MMEFLKQLLMSLCCFMLLKLMKFYSANVDEQITIFFTVDYEILLAVCSLIKLKKHLILR